MEGQRAEEEAEDEEGGRRIDCKHNVFEHMFGPGAEPEVGRRHTVRARPLPKFKSINFEEFGLRCGGRVGVVNLDSRASGSHPAHRYFVLKTLFWGSKRPSLQVRWGGAKPPT